MAQRYLHGPDAATNCDPDVKNALMDLKVSQTLPPATASHHSNHKNAPSNAYFQMVAVNDLFSIYPHLGVASDNAMSISVSTASAEACKVALSSQYWELDLSNTSDTMSANKDKEIDLAIKDMADKAKALLARQRELVKVGYLTP